MVTTSAEVVAKTKVLPVATQMLPRASATGSHRKRKCSSVKRVGTSEPGAVSLKASITE